VTTRAQHSPNGAEPPEARLDARLPSTGTDGQARARALAAVDVGVRNPAGLVAYESRGSLLVIGPEPYALEQARALGDRLQCVVLATDAEEASAQASGRTEAAGGVRVVRARLEHIEGHLGAFTVTVRAGGETLNLAQALGREREHFDMVLDLGRRPNLGLEMPPFGYYAPGRDAEALYRALREIPEMVGEFEKPTFFRYDADICAHGASGLAGCTRCLDTCPTGAIRSIGERVEVDPYLCQGAGSCATACPTGAITYAYPTVADLLESMKRLLHAYREAGGRCPVLLFHDGEAGRAWLAQTAACMPEQVLPVEVEEIGSVGMDAWLTLLAYGASGVALVAPPATAPSVRAEIERQVGYAAAVLDGMGHSGARVRLLDAAAEDLDVLGRLAAAPELPAGGFAAQDEKRTTLRLALEHLYAHAPAPRESAPLPEGAPFGEVRFDWDACTLCMACVSVCPAAALEAGGERPALRFIEWNCVQCGLCEAACPEDAIVPTPRLLYDPHKRLEKRTLKEEEPFKCVACGKPFATQSVMARMREKLAGHWMFQNPDALRRLEMCEDCRVKDMFAQEGGMVDPHKR